MNFGSLVEHLDSLVHVAVIGSHLKKIYDFYVVERRVEQDGTSTNQLVTPRALPVLKNRSGGTLPLSTAPQLPVLARQGAHENSMLDPSFAEVFN